ncbi:endolytic transglycosylase MltG [Paenibacillus periandrae]|uniref:endolytic transglycosylase MltG n=1 Tax=Paenibacillus periandrae TaxID=1761741 RepID=UPI0023DD6DD4|nr:endolytic transglycosylase MltG [Paenibacillus periandrae]
MRTWSKGVVVAPFSRVKKLVVSLIVIVIVVVVLASIGLGLYVKQALQPVAESSQPQTIMIPPGMSPLSIAELLESKGLIRNARVFTYYLKYAHQGSKFQAGEYEMLPGMTNDAIIDTFNKGLTVKEQGIKLTVPEGYTVRQIADKVQQQFGIDPGLFIEKAQQDNHFTAHVFSKMANQTQLRSRLEGYLFPETYEWSKDIKVEDMLNNMMLELDRKLEQLPDNWPQAMADRGQSFHEMLTIASLIEREAVLDEERPLVSGVIHNRLRKKMELQIDATVQYLFDKPKDRLFEKDLQTESPYNTYLHKGLPPGPIASPSLSSIKAAIYPADNNFLYYVTKKDGTKAHYFGETFDQHQKNIAVSKKNESTLKK